MGNESVPHKKPIFGLGDFWGALPHVQMMRLMFFFHFFSVCEDIMVGCQFLSVVSSCVFLNTGLDLFAKVQSPDNVSKDAKVV